MFPNRPMLGSSWKNSNAPQAQQQFPYQTGQCTTPHPPQNQMQQQWYKAATTGPSKVPFQQQWSVPSAPTKGQTAAEPSPTADQPALPTGPPPGPKPPPPNEPPVPPSDEKPPLPPEPPPDDSSAPGSKELKPQGPDEQHKLNQLQEQAQQWQQQQTPGYQQQYPYQQSAWQQQQPWQQQQQQNWNWNYQQPPPPQQPAQMNVPPPQQQYPGYGAYNQGGGYNAQGSMAPQPGQMNVPPPQPTQPPPVSVNTSEMEAVIVEEKQFNIQYQEWRQQYDDWKVQNQNHPDKELFTQYEQQWKQYESQMEDQRMSIVSRKDALQSKPPQSPADHPDIPTSSASGLGNGPDKPLNFNENRMPPVSDPPISSQQQNFRSEQSTAGFPPKQSAGFQQHDHSGPPPSGISSGFSPNQQRPPPGYPQDQHKGMSDSGFQQGGGFGEFNPDEPSRMSGRFNDQGNFSAGGYPSDNSNRPPGNFQQPPPNVSSSDGYNSHGGFNQLSQQNSMNSPGQRPRFPPEQNANFRPRFPDAGGPRSRFDGPRGGPMPFRPPGPGGAKQGLLGSGPQPLMSSEPGSHHSHSHDKDSETGDVRSEGKKSESEDNRMNDFKDDFDNDNQGSLDTGQQMNQFPGMNQRFPGPRGFGDSSGNQRFSGPMDGNMNRPFGQRGGGQFGRGFDGPMRPRFDGPMGRGLGGPMGRGFHGDRGGFNANRGRGFGGAMGRGFDGPRGPGFMASKGGEFNSPFGQSLDPSKGSGEIKDKNFSWKDEEDYEDDHGFGTSAGNEGKVEETGTEDQGEMDVDYDENEDQNLEGERRMGFDAPEEKESEKSNIDIKGGMNFEGLRFPGSRFGGPRMGGDVGSKFQGPRGQQFQGQSGPRFGGPRGPRFSGPLDGPSTPFGAQGPRGPNSNFGPRGPQINQPKPLMSLMDLDMKPVDDDDKKEETEQTKEDPSLKGEEAPTSELHSSAHSNADQEEPEQEENNEAYEANEFKEKFEDNNFNEQSNEPTALPVPSGGPNIRGMPPQRPRFPGAFQGFGQRPRFDSQGQRFGGPNFGGPRNGGPRFVDQRPNMPGPRFGQQRPGGPPFRSMGAQIRGPRPQGFPETDAGTEDYPETYPEEENTEETYPEEESGNTEYQENEEPEVPYPPMSHPGARGALRPMRGQLLNRGPFNGRGGRGMPPMRGQMRPRGPYPIRGVMPPRGGIRPMGAYPPRFQTPYQEPDYDEGQNEGEMAEEYDESAMYPAEEATEQEYGEHGDAGQEAEWGAEGEEGNYSEQPWGTEEQPPPNEYQQDRHKRLPQYPDPASSEYSEWREEPRDSWAEPERVDAYGRRIDPPAKRYRSSPPPEFDRRRLGEHEDPYGSRSPSRLYRDRYPPEKPEETPFVFAETIDYGHKSASGNIGFSLEKEITTQEVIDYGHGKSLDDLDAGNLDDFDSRGSSRDTELSVPSLEREIHLRGMASHERNSRERDKRDMRDREMRDRDREGRDRERDGRDRESRDRDRDRRERDTDRSRSRDQNRDGDRLNGSSSSRDRHAPASNSPSYKPGETRIETVNIDDILCKPGRSSRPPHIVLILRGVPGAGKTYVSKLIREKEVANGGSTPRMLCLDDYFMVEVEKTEKDPETGKMVKTKIMDFEYEEEMEEVYRQSLFKSFKKNIDDGFFNFIILDAVNDRVKHFAEFWSYAKSKGFQVYVVTLTSDVATCAKRNTHKRSAEEIQKLLDKWEDTPRHHLRLDIRSLLQEVAITEVEMEDTVTATEETTTEAKEEDKKPEEEEEDDEPEGVYKKSRWELETSENKLDKLDGINLKKRKRVPSPQSLDEYLQLDELRSKQNEPGKKRVRWADIEEKKHQSHRRELGFVVGQTQRDWERITDESSAHKALNQTKFI